MGFTDNNKQQLQQKLNVIDLRYGTTHLESTTLEKSIMFLNNNDIEDNNQQEEEEIGYDNSSTQPPMIVTNADLNDTLVDVCGILLPKKNINNISTKSTSNTATIQNSFVYTKTSTDNLKKLSVAVSQGVPVLLEGVIGSGKTALIHHLAYLTNNLGM